MRRLPEKIIYVILLIASTVWVSNQGGVIPYAFFFVVLLYLPVAVIYLIICRTFLTSHQEMDTDWLKKGQKGRYSLVIENAGFLPIGALRLIVAPGIFTFGEEFLTEEYSLMPRQRISVDTTIVCNYAGSYGVGVYRLMLRDPFDLIRQMRDLCSCFRIPAKHLRTEADRTILFKNSSIEYARFYEILENMRSVAQLRNVSGFGFRQFRNGGKLADIIKSRRYAEFRRRCADPSRS